jgi:tetratricopeptide (TPR) repeat protein
MLRCDPVGSVILTFLFLAGDTKAYEQQPVGMVLEDSSATVRRPGRELPMQATEGLELFPGDVLIASRGAVRFSFCSRGTAQSLPEKHELVLDAASLSDAAPVLQEVRFIRFCEMPAMDPFPKTEMAPRRSAILKGTLDSRISSLEPNQRNLLRQQLQPIDDALRDRTLDPANTELGLRVARALVLARFQLTEDAIAAFDDIYDQREGPAWTQAVAADLVRQADQSATEEELRKRDVEVKETPNQQIKIKNTYALLIGISQYRAESGIPSLKYADRDADTFAQHLERPRGGNLRRCKDDITADCEILVLLNKRATLSAVTNAFESFVKDHASRENALIVFLAAHGADPNMEEDWQHYAGTSKEPVILTYDSDYNEAKVTGYAMSELRNKLIGPSLRYGRVTVFVDVCRAGNIGPITDSRELQPAVRAELDPGKSSKANLGVFMASERDQDAYESLAFGKGHGAFTYSVIEALNPPQWKTDGGLSFAYLLDHIRGRVQMLTYEKQIPIGRAMNEHMIVEDYPALPGMSLPPAKPAAKKELRRPRGIRSSGQKPPDPPLAPPSPDAFLRAIATGRLRPEDGADNAMDDLAALKASMTPDLQRAYSDRLRIALEDRGQRVLLAYLRGEQNPPSREDFVRGANDFEAALRFNRRSTFTEARMLFCRGRALIFRDKNNQPDYAGARRLLEQSVRLDPTRAYAYNALGITFLEEAPKALEQDSQAPKYTTYLSLATAAFHDAIQRAPYWPFPWHNLALTVAEMGNYADAEADYRHGIALAPDQPYLPYNLALLFQKIHRAEEAQLYYRKAITAARDAEKKGLLTFSDARRPEVADAVNALGTLAAEEGSERRARSLYREAIKQNSKSLVARNNLALSLTAPSWRGKKRPSDDAEKLWAEVLAEDPSYLPSRIARATYFMQIESWIDAISDWLALLQAVPGLIDARIELARAYIATRQNDLALQQLKLAVDQKPDGVAGWQRIAEEYSLAGGNADARSAYQKAIEAAEKASDLALVAKLRKKLAAIRDSGARR